jgi:AraC-like DNA-binding protein
MSFSFHNEFQLIAQRSSQCVIVFPYLAFPFFDPYSSCVHVSLLTGKGRFLSGKGQDHGLKFSAPKNVNVEELRRLAESDIPVLAFAFKRRGAEDWAPEHSHARGQLFALTRGLVVVEAGSERWMFPSQRCAWIPPDCMHAARSVGGAAGSMLYLSAETCRGLPKKPCMFNSSELLFAIAHRLLTWNPRQPLNSAQKGLITVLRNEIRQPEQQPLRLPIPREERLARVAHALLDDVADERTLDGWADCAAMARRTFMRAFSAEVGMSFGRWRQQARLFASLEMLAQNKSVTDVAIAVGYDSVSAFIDMFRTMLGTTPHAYFRSRQERRDDRQL